jgi:hypothetical protein
MAENFMMYLAVVLPTLIASLLSLEDQTKEVEENQN